MVERKCITKSSIESTYDCGRDHQCTANAQQINAIDYPTIPASSEETNQALNNSIIEHECSTPNQASCLETSESQASQSEASNSESISSLMAKMKIKSKRRFRVLRTRSPYGRRLRFENKENNHNKLSDSLLEETTTISEQVQYQQEASACARDITQEETGNRSELNDSLLEGPNATSSSSEQSSFNDISKLNNEPTQGYIEESTPSTGLPLSESSVVEESKIKVEDTSTRGLPPSESLLMYHL